MKEKSKISERYRRQVVLGEFGEEGQHKLQEANVLVVGAGGLGCPALLYLAAAGVGTLGIVDNDTVALHNLHRQVIYTTQDIGLRKVEAAARRLQEMNPEIRVHTHDCRLTNQNALGILNGYDIVVDATDNLVSRYIISDACVLLKKPLVYGGIAQFEGQIAVLNGGNEAEPAVSFRDLFPKPTPPGSVLNCAEAGVLGVLPGIIGTMQATEVLKMITGIGHPLIHQLFTYNALSNSSYTFKLSAREEAAKLIPKDAAAFEQRNYETFCTTSTSTVEEIDNIKFQSLLEKPNLVVIDVREKGEFPEVHEFSHLKIPLSELPANAHFIKNDTVVLFCQSGKRSREAAQMLLSTFGHDKKIYSLKGGILYWKQHQ
jgi:sulfur-carrier protein adenylyltransferase/sulfurtransferase